MREEEAGLPALVELKVAEELPEGGGQQQPDRQGTAGNGGDGCRDDVGGTPACAMAELRAHG